MRKPESEANDALRAAININGSDRGHIARRESHLGVARTDLTIQDLPSGHPMAAVEAKAVTSADALAPGFLTWFHPQVSGDVAKLRRTITGERFFIVWKTHWTWMARPEMYAYPRLLRGTPTTRDTMLNADQLTSEVRKSHEQLVAVLAANGVTDISAHIVAAGEHRDIGSVILTAHLGTVA